MTNEEIEQLKKQREEIDKQINNKKNDLYVKTWKESSIIGKIVILIGLIAVLGILINISILVINKLSS